MRKLLGTLLLLLSSIFAVNYSAIKGIAPQNYDEFKPRINPQQLYLQYKNQLYNTLGDTSVNEYAFDLLLKGYFKLKHEGVIENDTIVTLIDFSKPSNEKRFYVFDLKNKKVLIKTYVAHGRLSGNIYAKHFSNKIGSKKSSIGFYVTNEIYHGSNGLSLRLDGLEYTNNKARARGIVIHGSDYVSESYINSGRLGRSLGCPAVPQSIKTDVIYTLKGKSCVFIYYPDKNYLSRSLIINSRDYLSEFRDKNRISR